MRWFCIITMLFFLYSNIYGNNEARFKIHIDNFLKYYDASKVVVKCDIVRKKGYLYYKINRIYRGKKYIQKVSKNGYIIYKNKLENRKKVKAKEVLLLFVSLDQTPPAPQSFYYLRNGNLLVGNKLFSPEILGDLKKVKDALK